MQASEQFLSGTPLNGPKARTLIRSAFAKVTVWFRVYSSSFFFFEVLLS